MKKERSAMYEYEDKVSKLHRYVFLAIHRLNRSMVFRNRCTLYRKLIILLINVQYLMQGNLY